MDRAYTVGTLNQIDIYCSLQNNKNNNTTIIGDNEAHHSTHSLNSSFSFSRANKNSSHATGRPLFRSSRSSSLTLGLSQAQQTIELGRSLSKTLASNLELLFERNATSYLFFLSQSTIGIPPTSLAASAFSQTCDPLPVLSKRLSTSNYQLPKEQQNNIMNFEKNSDSSDSSVSIVAPKKRHPTNKYEPHTCEPVSISSVTVDERQFKPSPKSLFFQLKEMCEVNDELSMHTTHFSSFATTAANHTPNEHSHLPTTALDLLIDKAWCCATLITSQIIDSLKSSGNRPPRQDLIPQFTETLQTLIGIKFLSIGEVRCSNAFAKKLLRQCLSVCMCLLSAAEHCDMNLHLHVDSNNRHDILISASDLPLGIGAVENLTRPIMQYLTGGHTASSCGLTLLEEFSEEIRQLSKLSGAARIEFFINLRRRLGDIVTIHFVELACGVAQPPPSISSLPSSAQPQSILQQSLSLSSGKPSYFPWDYLGVSSSREGSMSRLFSTPIPSHTTSNHAHEEARRLIRASFEELDRSRSVVPPHPSDPVWRLCLSLLSPSYPPVGSVSPSLHVASLIRLLMDSPHNEIRKTLLQRRISSSAAALTIQQGAIAACNSLEEAHFVLYSLRERSKDYSDLRLLLLPSPQLSCEPTHQVALPLPPTFLVPPLALARLSSPVSSSCLYLILHAAPFSNSTLANEFFVSQLQNSIPSFSLPCPPSKSSSQRHHLIDLSDPADSRDGLRTPSAFQDLPSSSTPSSPSISPSASPLPSDSEEGEEEKWNMRKLHARKPNFLMKTLSLVSRRTRDLPSRVTKTLEMASLGMGSSAAHAPTLEVFDAKVRHGGVRWTQIERAITLAGRFVDHALFAPGASIDSSRSFAQLRATLESATACVQSSKMMLPLSSERQISIQHQSELKAQRTSTNPVASPCIIHSKMIHSEVFCGSKTDDPPLLRSHQHHADVVGETPLEIYLPLPSLLLSGFLSLPASKVTVNEHDFSLLFHISVPHEERELRKAALGSQLSSLLFPDPFNSVISIPFHQILTVSLSSPSPILFLTPPFWTSTPNLPSPSLSQSILPPVFAPRRHIPIPPRPPPASPRSAFPSFESTTLPPDEDASTSSKRFDSAGETEVRFKPGRRLMLTAELTAPCHSSLFPPANFGSWAEKLPESILQERKVNLCIWVECGSSLEAVNTCQLLARIASACRLKTGLRGLMSQSLKFEMGSGSGAA